MPTIHLPAPDRSLAPLTLRAPLDLPVRPECPFNRVAFAAAHVVCDPLADVDPWLDAAIDWEATAAFRHHLWDLGLGVAEAMDTAQRGAGLEWPVARALVARTLREARSREGARVACGAGTDQLAPGAAATLADVEAAYIEQVEAIEDLGGDVILMASRALAATSRAPDDYARVYGNVLRQIRGKAILHWLGEMFDPALAGYWGSNDHDAAMRVCLSIIAENAEKIDGIKISLLSKEREIAMRRLLPPGIRMYTGDDFDFPELIAGDAEGYSDALLGVFDPIAPIASAALARLAAGDRAGFDALMAPSVPLSRRMFCVPTRFYKTGVVFIAWLNGFQTHFTMLGGQESARSLLHLADLFRLADAAGILRDPDLACRRMRAFLATRGVEA